MIDKYDIPEEMIDPQKDPRRKVGFKSAIASVYLTVAELGRRIGEGNLQNIQESAH